MTRHTFAVVPMEAVLDPRLSGVPLRLLCAVWSVCLRDGRVTWSPFLTSGQIAEMVGIEAWNVPRTMRHLAELDYILLGPNVVMGIYSVRPHQRFGETGPSPHEMEELFGSLPVGRAPNNSFQIQAGKTDKTIRNPACRHFTTTAIMSQEGPEDKSSSSSSSKNLARKPHRSLPVGTTPHSFPWTVVQQGILDFLAENGMEGVVPVQVVLTPGMTFRRVVLIVKDGIEKVQTTGLILTRLRGRDIPPNVCPLCGAEDASWHKGFDAGDRAINCPLYDAPDMTDEDLALAWRRVREMRRLDYWTADEPGD